MEFLNIKVKVGDLLIKRYKVLQILGGEGKSGMGVVFICHDQKLNRYIAIKSFQERFFHSLAARQNFAREALAWVRLKPHPYIVQAIWTQLTHGERLFIGLEYIAPDKEGRNTLTHYFQTPISLEQSLVWGIQFCYGMEHAISYGVTPHRDIKPDNIMITDEKKVKITDFGLVSILRHADNLNLEKDLKGKIHKGLRFFTDNKGVMIAGTLPWMAPEQFEGKSDARSDIYSFGIVLYQMINEGKLPYVGKTMEDWYAFHKSKPLPEIRSELFPVIQRCTEKNPKKRYQKFKELRNALEVLFKEKTGKTIEPPSKIEELDEWYYYHLGVSYGALGFQDESITQTKKALSVNPDFVDAIVNMGNHYEGQQKYKKALKEFKKALLLLPDNPIIHTNIGIMYNKLGNPNKAIIELKKALELDPNYSSAHNSLGCAYRDLKRYQAAIKEFKELLRIDPNYIVGYFNLAFSLTEAGKYREAIKAYETYIKITPPNQQYNKQVAFRNMEICRKKLYSRR